MKIEIELPDFEGYEYTGEHRYPLHDEWGCRGPNQDQVRNCNPRGALFILRKIVKEPTLLERIEEKWGDKLVQLLTYNDSNGFLSIEGDEDCEPHVLAQSIKGFVGYVYDIEGLFTKVSPTFRGTNNTNFPVAVLFTK